MNGGDHATTDDALPVHSADLLTYTVVIRNNGEVALTIDDLSDSLVPAACPTAVGTVLEPGETYTCTYQVAAAGDAHNVATVSATDALDRPVTDTDETFVNTAIIPTAVEGVVFVEPTVAPAAAAPVVPLTAPAVVAPLTELPRTGGPLQAQTQAALAFIGAGLVMALAGRRRWNIRRAD